MFVRLISESNATLLFKYFYLLNKLILKEIEINVKQNFVNRHLFSLRKFQFGI